MSQQDDLQLLLYVERREQERRRNLGPPPDIRERILTDPEFHAACAATGRQARIDGGYLDAETVAKVLMAFDRSGIGRLVVS